MKEENTVPQTKNPAARARAGPKAAGEPIPDWLETPDDTSYCLTMFDSGGSSQQEIELTREEFVALKEHLAGRRSQPEANTGPTAVERV